MPDRSSPGPQGSHLSESSQSGVKQFITVTKSSTNIEAPGHQNRINFNLDPSGLMQKSIH